MKTFKFSQLSDKAKIKAIKEYIADEIGTYDDGTIREKTSFEDAEAILKIDLEDEHFYTKSGNFSHSIDDYIDLMDKYRTEEG